MRLHIVDLDGALAGEPRHLELISRMASAVMIPIQVGGGIRSMTSIEALFKTGADRVILGTAAIRDAELVREACRRFSDAIVVSLDARDGKLAVEGWQVDTGLDAIEAAYSLVKLGARRFIYTDINRDGTMTEPNFTAIYEFVDGLKFSVIAAGGITRLTHLKILKNFGLEGAIVGKALYTGSINLKEALAKAS